MWRVITMAAILFTAVTMATGTRQQYNGIQSDAIGKAFYFNRLIDGYERPRRPESFQSKEQISKYLQELKEFYSIHGRGRYGKRRTTTVAGTHRDNSLYPPYYNYQKNK